MATYILVDVKQCKSIIILFSVSNPAELPLLNPILDHAQSWSSASKNLSQMATLETSSR